MYKVSVIIPTYNRAHCIMRSIQSVLNQSYPIHEIIIADDCSSDNTESLINELDNPLVKYYRLPENRGAGGARNYGVLQATGDWIAFHDSDDEWLPDKLKKQVEYSISHPECDLIYCAYETTIFDHQKLIVPNMDGSLKLEGEIFVNLLSQNTIGAPTVLMKKEIFFEVGGFDESMKCLEDWDFAIKVAEKHIIGFLPEVQLMVTKSEGSVSSNIGYFYQCSCLMLKRYKQHYIDNNILQEQVDSLMANALLDNVVPLVQKLITIYLTS